MAKRLNAAAKELLAKIGTATVESPVYVDTASVAFGILKDNGLVYVNEAVKDSNGHTASVLSPDGIEKNKTLGTAGSGNTAPAIDPDSLPIIDSYPAWESRRGGGPRPPQWPFDRLAVGQAFPVLPSEGRPEPWKALQSTVGSHNAKLRKAYEEAKKSDPNAPEPAVFKITKGEYDGKEAAIVRRFA